MPQCAISFDTSHQDGFHFYTDVFYILEQRGEQVEINTICVILLFAAEETFVCQCVQLKRSNKNETDLDL